VSDTPLYTVGLDLGQSQDPTALAALESRHEPAGWRHAVRHLERYPLGTPYVGTPGVPGVVDLVRSLLLRPPLPGCTLAVDRTGVGRGVVDAFRAARLPCRLLAITITAGGTVRREGWEVWVPKADLVAVVQVGLQSGRLTIAPRLPLAEVLARELKAFRVKLTAAGNETFSAREREHDDVVLALAVGLWAAERCPPLTAGSIGTPAKSPPAFQRVPAGILSLAGAGGVAVWRGRG
jgi:hypothetical protein